MSNVCEKVQEMSYCLGSAVTKLFESQTTSSLKQVDLLSEAQNLIGLEIKRLSRGLTKPSKSSASAPVTGTGRKDNAKAATATEAKAATATEAKAATATEAKAATATEAKKEAKTKTKAKAAPTPPVQDLEVEDDFEEEKYPVGFADISEEDLALVEELDL